MTARNDGGPAFDPVMNPAHEPCEVSLRDWFAGQALAGLGARAYDHTAPDIAGAMARDAYTVADAMLKVREQDR